MQGQVARAGGRGGGRGQVPWPGVWCTGGGGVAGGGGNVQVYDPETCFCIAEGVGEGPVTGQDQAPAAGHLGPGTRHQAKHRLSGTGHRAPEGAPNTGHQATLATAPGLRRLQGGAGAGRAAYCGGSGGAYLTATYTFLCDRICPAGPLLFPTYAAAAASVTQNFLGGRTCET